MVHQVVLAVAALAAVPCLLILGRRALLGQTVSVAAVAARVAPELALQPAAGAVPVS
jgi:hypothetical protein